MPNDPAGQFPMPVEPAPTREVSLTDEVAPDLSTPPTETIPKLERSETPPSGAIPEPVTTPTEPPLQAAPAPAEPIPAVVVPSRPFPVVTILLLLVSIGAVAAAYFFFQQNQTLSQQLTEIERTLQRQRVKESQTTPNPTPSPTIEISPTGTISATTTPPTVSPTPAAGKAFDQIVAVLTAAADKYPNAQLLMITATGIENPATAITKYWFRQTAADKRYLYILAEPGKDLAVVDQQIYVTPDDNIPSLNDLAKNDQLGIDLPEALTIAAAACPPNFSCAFTPTSGQFIKAGTTLWQIGYKPADGTKPFVIQIDSLTKKILYKNQ